MTEDVYLRYYVGHKGKFGHEFLEFELCPDGRLRYANNSNYKRDVLIRKELRVGHLVRQQVLQMLLDSGLFGGESGSSGLDDRQWPAPNRDGRQELEVIARGEHVLLTTCKIGSLVDIQGAQDSDGVRTFHYLVQDLKTLVLSLIAAHFKIKPI